jgi:hypothetical protein
MASREWSQPVPEQTMPGPLPAGPGVDSVGSSPDPRIEPDLVSRVAETLLASVQIQLVGDRSRVDLSLDLGRLGRAQAELTRSVDGEVGIVLRLEEGSGRALLAGRLPELVHGLEQRGLEVERLQLSGPEGEARSASREVGEGVPSMMRRQGDAPGDGRSRSTYVAPELGEEDENEP